MVSQGVAWILHFRNALLKVRFGRGEILRLSSHIVSICHCLFCESTQFRLKGRNLAVQYEVWRWRLEVWTRFATWLEDPSFSGWPSTSLVCSMSWSSHETELNKSVMRTFSFVKGSSPASKKLHRLAHPCVTRTRNPVHLRLQTLFMK